MGRACECVVLGELKFPIRNSDIYSDNRKLCAPTGTGVLLHNLAVTILSQRSTQSSLDFMVWFLS